ncbi:MAG: hypothetical protein E6K22_12950 [Gammaproteobacteria bacterium]|nr:MAG: hypothetical protein E6K22_12950 [Gammaproteobacteria bacterium]
MLSAFNELFGVICKFRTELGRRTLADYINVANVYPAGRFDTDSEGLLAAANSMPRERLAPGAHSQRKAGNTPHQHRTAISPEVSCMGSGYPCTEI